MEWGVGSRGALGEGFPIPGGRPPRKRAFLAGRALAPMRGAFVKTPGPGGGKGIGPPRFATGGCRIGGGEVTHGTIRRCGRIAFDELVEECGNDVFGGKTQGAETLDVLGVRGY